MITALSRASLRSARRTTTTTITTSTTSTAVQQLYDGSRLACSNNNNVAFPVMTRNKYNSVRSISSSSSNSRPRVVILGSGWGGNTLARKLDKEKFDVRLISPANHFLFTPLLPSTAVGTLEFRAIQEPVRTIPGLGEYYQAKARTVDTNSKTITCTDIFHKQNDFSVSYDYLVVACGNKTNTFNTPGINEREGEEIFFLKHLYHARQIRNRILECFERACNPTISAKARDRLLSFIVVGGGPTSCEFTTELHEFITKDVSKWYPELIPHIKLTIVEAGPGLLGSFHRALADYYLKDLQTRAIDVKLSTAITGVEIIEEGEDKSGSNNNNNDDHHHHDHFTVARLADGTSIPFGAMVWSAGLAPVKFVQNCGLGKLQERTGRISVDSYLRVPTYKGRIFAIGDCATVEDQFLPPTASVAEQQASYLGDCFNNYYYKHSDAVMKDGDGEEKSTEKKTDDENDNDDTDDDLPLPGPVVPAMMPVPQLDFLNPYFSNGNPKFVYKNRGSMASMGFGKSVMDLTHSDLLPASMKDSDKNIISGSGAFVAYRTAYLTKQLSYSNMMLIPMYWFKQLVFGRDISRF